MDFIAVLCTHPDATAAQELAAALVEEKLAACVNILPGLVSVYVWQGRRERSEEVLLLIKTRASLLEPLRAAIRQRHPYTTPEIIALPVLAGDPDYLAWVQASTLGD